MRKSVVSECAEGMELTLDISMKFAFAMEIFEATEEFADYDGNVFFSEYSWFHLRQLSAVAYDNR